MIVSAGSAAAQFGDALAEIERGAIAGRGSLHSSHSRCACAPASNEITSSAQLSSSSANSRMSAQIAKSVR
jgi:hypothetical protein